MLLILVVSLFFQAEPVYTPGTERFVDHMTLYRCRLQNPSSILVSGQSFNCFTDAPDHVQFCREHVASFGHGKEVLTTCATLFSNPCSVKLDSSTCVHLLLLLFNFFPIIHIRQKQAVAVGWKPKLQNYGSAFFPQTLLQNTYFL